MIKRVDDQNGLMITQDDDPNGIMSNEMMIKRDDD
jgi:hypothetical protein